MTSFTMRALLLVAALRETFPEIRKIGGYCCRRNTASPQYTSIHGTGRAIDIYGSDSTLLAVADWLVDQAGRFGIQYVIWNNGFSGAGKSGAYKGPDPHLDHVHAEVLLDESTPRRSSGGGAGSMVALAVLLLGIFASGTILRNVRL